MTGETVNEVLPASGGHGNLPPQVLDSEAESGAGEAGERDRGHPAPPHPPAAVNEDHLQRSCCHCPCVHVLLPSAAEGRDWRFRHPGSGERC